MNVSKLTPVFLCLLSVATVCNAQVMVNPQVRTKAAADGKVTVVDVAPHFVTAIRLPEPVNSIALGDPALFQVEHSEREPELVLVKALTERNAETNLLISSTRGRQFSLVLVNRSSVAISPQVDFLLQYKPAASFLVEPQIVPFPLIGQTTPITKSEPVSGGTAKPDANKQPSFAPTTFPVKAIERAKVQAEALPRQPRAMSMDDLLERQENAPLPTMYGQRIEGENFKGDRLRVGISEVIDGGDQVTVLFSAVNPSEQAILLMPTQISIDGNSR